MNGRFQKQQTSQYNKPLFHSFIVLLSHNSASPAIARTCYSAAPFNAQIIADSRHRWARVSPRVKTRGDRDLWSGAWFTQRLEPLHRSACTACHKPLGREQYADDSHVINLSTPEASLLLRAHLSVEQGGRGIAKEVNGKRPPLFLSKADQTYTAFLEAIQEGKRDMLATPRMDMPGAQPVQGPQDWGLFRGTSDPKHSAPGNFWSLQEK